MKITKGYKFFFKVAFVCLVVSIFLPFAFESHSIYVSYLYPGGYDGPFLSRSYRNWGFYWSFMSVSETVSTSTLLPDPMMVGTWVSFLPEYWSWGTPLPRSIFPLQIALIIIGFARAHNNEVVGHAVWHETNTEEHRKGDARDREDREALEKLLGKNKNFVELHEIWLIQEHRGKGYGDMVHDFFEIFMKEKGYSDVVFYADHPAAVAICRKHGYEEGGYLKGLKEYVFHLSLKKNT